ncbi:hypothetical protein [Nonomuraea basaltis]|uniref:hypothetical protein n=1 Tax=Nonomuraea basaltis TaxID=2495887 RepID=UPI00110C6D95|nr:hypothetical protein [Nonomuraea basaltis]TMS00297.1 hypothetical protein EJK15_02620 [Nonomuraea basaltis]
MTQSSRHLLVWVHVVTSVSWMSQALALFALSIHSVITGDGAGYRMAHLLDNEVLLHFANASAFTGLMLAAMTKWGYFRYWWVLIKLVITLSQLYAGIFLLGPRLSALADGTRDADPVLLAATLLMASAIAFQAWLSVAKPWKRTPWAEARPRTIAPPGWVTGFVLLVPVLDFLLAVLVFGNPAPLFFVLTAVAYPIWRARARRRDPALA